MESRFKANFALPFKIDDWIEKITDIGVGAWGKIELYKLKNLRPPLENLCDRNGLIAVKTLKEIEKSEKTPSPIYSGEVSLSKAEIAKASFDNECDIFNYLYKISDKKSNPHYPLGLPVEIDGKVYLFIEFVPLQESTKYSYNLENFISDYLNNTNINNNNNLSANNMEFSNQLRNDWYETLNTFCIEMKNHIDALHENHILHNDIAPRNFLFDMSGNEISLKLTDFGLSQHVDTIFKTETEQQSNRQIPVRYANKERLSDNKEVSVISDMYAFKISLIETIGLVLGVPQKRILFIKDEKDKNQDICNAVCDKDKGNQYALKQYVKNLEAECEKCTEIIKKNQVQRFIESYKKYLTTMPTETDLVKAKESDHDLFLQASGLSETRFVLIDYYKFPNRLGDQFYSKIPETFREKMRQVHEVSTDPLHKICLMLKKFLDIREKVDNKMPSSFDKALFKTYRADSAVKNAIATIEKEMIEIIKKIDKEYKTPLDTYSALESLSSKIKTNISPSSKSGFSIFKSKSHSEILLNELEKVDEALEKMKIEKSKPLSVQHLR